MSVITAKHKTTIGKCFTGEWIF